MTSMRSFATRTAALATLLTLLALPTAPLAAAPALDSEATWTLSWSALAEGLARLGDRVLAVVASSENDPDLTGAPQIGPFVDPNGLTAAPDAPLLGTDTPGVSD